jgi:drug/metabolite transporter (DMT)-like permease
VPIGRLHRVAVIALALYSAVAWGCADFLGGLASRRSAVFSVVAVSQATGVTILLVVLAVADVAAPDWHAIGWGFGAGLSISVALTAFYRALSVGTMSLVAPITATGVIVPVIVGLAAGERPGPLAGIGGVLALAGAALAIWSGAPESRRGLGLAAVAALGFGGIWAFLGQVPESQVLWAIGTARGTCLAIVMAVLVFSAHEFRITRPSAGLAVSSGFLDLTAISAFTIAADRGLLSLVSVISALYPIATLALAAVVVDERLSVRQWAGVATALAGVALVAST